MSETTASSVLRKALESAAKETAESSVRKLLSAVALAAAVEPYAAAAGAAAQALVTALAKEGDAIEAKLDRLLREPLETGAAGVREALSVTPRTAQQRTLRGKRVHAALDRLEQAVTLALQTGDAETARLARLHQTLGYALLPGGTPFLERLAKELSPAAEALRTEASRLEDAAERPAAVFKPPFAGAAFARSQLDAPAPEGRYDEPTPRTPSEKRLIRAAASELRAEAASLDGFLALARALAAKTRKA